MPEWLPASLQVSPVPKSLFKIDYHVFASLIPDQKGKTEPISNSKFFVVVNPMNEVPEKKIFSLTFENDLGGFLGLGQTKSYGILDFSKNVYFLGEKVQVALELDNSKCEKDISFYKVNLVRCITTPDTTGSSKNTTNPPKKHKSFHKEDEMLTVLYDGVAKKTKHAKTLEFSIPCIEMTNYIKLEKKEEENVLI